MSLIGLMAIFGLNFSGKFGNLLAQKGVLGSALRGMVGVFSFFIVAVLLIWTVGVMIVIALIFFIATFFGVKFKKTGFFWGKRANKETGDNPWPYWNNQSGGDVRTITLESREWKDITPKKKSRKRRTKKDGSEAGDIEYPQKDS